MPYTHLRTFKKSLYNKINKSLLKNKDGNYWSAGGDNALFYALIEQCEPNEIKCIQRILYVYNDKNPLADRFTNPQLQNKNAKEIRSMKTSPEECNRPIKVLIGIPVSRSSGDDAKLNSSLSIMRMLCKMCNEKYDISVSVERYYGFSVAQTRNIMMDAAIKYDFDYLLTVDGDMIIPDDTLVKLLSYNVDVVGGLYRQRGKNIPEAYINHKRATLEQVKDIGIIDSTGVGMGCALIKTDVLKAVGYPYCVYHENQIWENTLSEDYDFCKKVISKGFKIYVDTSTRCKHLSEQILEI
jgi:hypothetical protein